MSSSFESQSQADDDIKTQVGSQGPHVHRAVDDIDSRSVSTSAYRMPSTIPLNPSDFLGWSVMMEAMLVHAGLWDFVRPLTEQEKAAQVLNGPGPVSFPSSLSSSSSSTIGTGSLSVESQDSRKNEAFMMLMLALRDTESQRVLIGVPSRDPRALWAALKERYSAMPPTVVANLYAQFLSEKQSTSETVQQFADRIYLARHRLATNGRVITELDSKTVLVSGLQEYAASAVSTYYNIDPAASFEKLVAVANGEEKRLQLAGRTIPSRAAHHTTNSSALGVEHSQSNAQRLCFVCGKPGHIAAQCSRRIGSRPTATPQEIAAGACPKPGHKSHKATDCRNGAPPHNAHNRDRVTAAATASSSSEAPLTGKVVSVGLANIVQREVGSSELSKASTVDSLMANSVSETGNRLPVVLDSGAGRTVIPSTETLLHGKAAPDVLITVANGQSLSSPSEGTAVIDGAGGLRLHVKNALQHDHIDRSLLSVGSVLADKSKVTEVVFRQEGAAAFTPSGAILFTASAQNGIFVLDSDVEKSRLVAEAFSDRNPLYPSDSGSETKSLIGTDGSTPTLSVEAVSALTKLWHHRFCHRSYQGLGELVRSKAVTGLDEVKVSSTGEESHTRCVGCAQGKAKRQPFSNRLDPSLDAQHVQARLHADLAGPLSESLGGSRYFLVLMDEWTEFGVVFFVGHKSDVASKIMDWCRQSRTRHGRELIEFHSDGGGEFVNEKLANFFRQTGTHQTTTVAHTPQHNGKAERLIRTLTEWANAILTTAGAAKKFWPYAIATAMYTRNITQICKRPSPSDSNSIPITPRQRWLNLSRPPSVDHMRVFGCDADVLYTVSPGLKLKKLTKKSRLCMFLGYDEDKNDAWRFYDPSTRTVFSSRDATFYEDQFTVSQSVRLEEQGADEGDESEDDTDYFTRTTFDNETKLAKLISLDPQADVVTNQGALKSNSNSNEEIEESSSSENESDSSDDEDGAEVESIVGSSDESDSPLSSSNSSSIEPTGTSKAKKVPFTRSPYSMRDRSKIQPTTKYGMVNGNLAQARHVYISLAHALVLDEDTSKSGPSPDLGLPRNYSEAIEKKEWADAIKRELAAHEENGTWSFVELPTGRKAIGYKYVFRVKLNPDGSVERYKCRLTAQGFAQRAGIDFSETYAPVLNYHTLRLILAIVAAEDYELHQMDVETAFLNAKVEEDLYMRVPEGVEAPPNTVCKLNKALYGIKQAPHAWHADIANTLTLKLGYASSPLDPCLFIKTSASGRKILFPLFVDDCFPACHTQDLAEMQQDKARLMEIYKIKDSGDATLLLGMRIQRDRAARTIHLDQQVYIERLLADYGATNVKPANTPQSTELEFEANSSEDNESQSNSTEANASSQGDRSSFATIVGSLQYAAQSTRPDISFAVNTLARGLVSPTQAHRDGAWRVLRYLAGTSSLGITFGGSLTNRPLLAWSDANWAGRNGENDGRSTSGWLVQIGTGPIAWSSKKQGMVTLSSTESEYVAATLAAQQLVWTRSLLEACGFSSIHPISNRPIPTTLYCDNTAAITLAGNHSKVSQRTKHINVRYHFIRMCVADGTVQLKWVSTNEQIADILTKPLGPNIFHRLRPALMGTVEHKVNGHKREWSIDSIGVGRYQGSTTDSSSF